MKIVKNETLNRRLNILNKLRTTGKIFVDNLATEYDVSMVTIRNDLNYLEQNDHLTRIHGGAILKQSNNTKVIFEYRIPNLTYTENLQLIQALSKICQLYSSLFISNYGLWSKLLPFFSMRNDLLIVTTNLGIADIITKLSINNVYLIGGLINNELNINHTAQAQNNWIYNPINLNTSVDNIFIAGYLTNKRKVLLSNEINGSQIELSFVNNSVNKVLLITGHIDSYVVANEKQLISLSMVNYIACDENDEITKSSLMQLKTKLIIQFSNIAIYKVYQK